MLLSHALKQNWPAPIKLFCGAVILLCKWRWYKGSAFDALVPVVNLDDCARSGRQVI